MSKSQKPELFLNQEEIRVAECDWLVGGPYLGLCLGKHSWQKVVSRGYLPGEGTSAKQQHTRTLQVRSAVLHQACTGAARFIWTSQQMMELRGQALLTWLGIRSWALVSTICVTLDG